MPRFAANLSPMYVELPFADRFAAAAADGFTSVECLLPCDHSAEQLAGIAPAGMETQRLRAIYLVNLEVQMDLYHLQIAGVSQRQEPDIGELNCAHRFDLIDEVSAACSWEDWVGCEYRPRLGGQPRGTSAGLGWLQRARTLR